MEEFLEKIEPYIGQHGDAEAIGCLADRYLFARPRFEGGEPVCFGCEVQFEDRAFKVDEIRYGCDKTVAMYDWSADEGGVWRDGSWLHVKRPAPLDEDGCPICVGETVYDRRGRAWEVYSVEDGVRCTSDDSDGYSQFGVFNDPSDVSHTPPDNRERIRDMILGSIAMGCTVREVEDVLGRIDALVRAGRWLDE